MNHKLNISYYSLLLLWLCFVYGTGIWLFTTGFLLTRPASHRQSSCGDNHNDDSGQIKGRTPGCSFPDRYRKAIVLVTDGLVYDFDGHFGHNSDNEVTNSDQKIINNLFNTYENRTKVYKLFDRYLLSMRQTLETIITGSLPTFIKYHNNYKLFDIIEDNLIKQMNSKSRKTILMANKSLKDLVPNDLFSQTFYYSEVTDLERKLVEEVKSRDFDLLISDLPTFSHLKDGQQLMSSNESLVANRWTKLAKLFKQLVSLIEDDDKTILFVISDRTSVKVSSNANPMPNDSPFIFTFSSQKLSPIESASNFVSKIDLVPTLSLLLGIPIPFSNVGRVMSSLFEYPIDCQHVKPTNEFACHEDIPQIQSLWTSISALRINVAQIQRYVASVVPNVIDNKLEELLERYDRNWVLLNHIPSDDKSATIDKLKELRNNYNSYIVQLTDHLTNNLSVYDLRLMFSGLIVILLSCVFNLVIIYWIQSHQHLMNYCSKLCIGIVMGAITANLIRILDFPFHENIVNDILFLSAVTSIVVPMGSLVLSKVIFLLSHNRSVYNNKIITNLFIKPFIDKPLIIIMIVLPILFPIKVCETNSMNSESGNHLFQSLLLLIVTIYQLLMIFQSPNSGLGLMIISMIALIYLILLRKTGSDNSFITIIIWYLISTYGFFITGHHKSVEMIPKDIIFTTKNINFWIHIIPIIINIYSSQLFLAICLPLLAVIVPQLHRTTNRLQYTSDGQQFFKTFANCLLKYMFLIGLTLFGISLLAAIVRNDPMSYQ
ncbi:GPI ethanolamine phosphate transferase 3-like [Oppia nitens]|uniref:GPI ethanolamine phosphate transferase 3-like n=1 Tax=Oppia nitens TaxID=1686743 RepID=UPI0023DA3A46|nr:GPI ethanolamine phosphate transferase 3-like [Oppia nitens]